MKSGCSFAVAARKANRSPCRTARPWPRARSCSAKGRTPKKRQAPSPYTVYTEAGCKDEFLKAGAFTLSGTTGENGHKTLPSSEPETLSPGTYYWKVTYSGDEANTPASACGAIETVEPQSVHRAECKGGTVCAPDGSSSVFRISEGGSGCNAEWVWGDDRRRIPECLRRREIQPRLRPAAPSLPCESDLLRNLWLGDPGLRNRIPRVFSELGVLLRGGGKEGKSIAVPNGTAVTESAVLFGEKPYTEEATGTVTYTVYTEAGCKHELLKAGAFTLSGTTGENGHKTLPSSQPETLSPGTYYWKVTYSGDGANTPATECRAIETVEPPGGPPIVETTKATEVGQTSSALTAQVNPNFRTVAACKFEYGTTAKYGSTVSCAKLPGSGSSPLGSARGDQRAETHTTYHFRISATNNAGTSKGEAATHHRTCAPRPSQPWEPSKSARRRRR